MSEAPGACHRCGGRAADRLPGGLCPACLLTLALPDALADEADADAAAGAGQRVGLASTCRILTLLAGDDERTVYLAEREGTRGFVTLEVRKRGAGPPSTPAEFSAWLTAVRALEHRNLARVLDGCLKADGGTCVVTEHTPGPALERYCRSPGVSPADTICMLEAVCDALAFAHDRGVVHGRLGGASVVVVGRDRPEPRLIGFAPVPSSVGPGQDVAALAEMLAGILASSPSQPRQARMPPSRPEAGWASLNELRAWLSSAAQCPTSGTSSVSAGATNDRGLRG